MHTLDTNHPDWRPPHCPNANCPFHDHLRTEWAYKRSGYFRRQAPPTRIRRYQCKHCGVTFSSQTFSVTYYLKRPDILAQLMTKTTGGMANRQAADDLGVAPNTVDMQLNRLGRHCLLLHKHFLDQLRRLSILGLDGFESFELSQYHPFHFHLAVDCQSALFLGFTDSPLRRKGSMTPGQRRRRRELEARFGRPDPQAVRKDVQELLEIVVDPSVEVTIRSDLHRSYPPAIRAYGGRTRHEVTSSREYRDRHNALYEINLLDLLIRHAAANHRRQTIAWAKRRQAAALRLMVFLVWRNYVRLRWRKQGKQTPAMEAGLLDRPLTVQEVLGQRLFVTKANLRGRWREYYWGEVTTPALGRNRRYDRKRAI
jgi:transposase-like protein